MENNSRFFENNKCEYFPCHKGLQDFNCLFCYCPFYAWEKCPGNNKYIERPDGSRIKVCTDCNLPHVPENYDFIMETLRLGKDAYALQQEKLRNSETKFYGIGVGPGEPELITRQAEKIIKLVDVLILPAKDKESCRAYVITESAIPTVKGKECVFMPFPMSMKEPELAQFHESVANKVEAYLKAGKSVGFLTIGDVSLYSTFAYVERIVREHGFETESVSGITSFSAAAARLGVPVALGSEQVHVIPGSANPEEAMKLEGNIIFMKSGKRLMELREILLKYEKEQHIKVQAVSNCGMENERVIHGAKDLSDEAGYLTVVIVTR